MTLEEAIKTAIHMEIRVRNMYREFAQRVAEHDCARVLGALADEEHGHVVHLEEKLKELKETGEVTVQKIGTIVPNPDKIREGLSNLTGKLQIAERQDELKMLEQALNVEAETSSFYERMVAELPAGQREFFEPFLDIERGHLAIVKAEIDAVSNMGFWFDFREFNLSQEA